MADPIKQRMSMISSVIMQQRIIAYVEMQKNMNSIMNIVHPAFKNSISPTPENQETFQLIFFTRRKDCQAPTPNAQKIKFSIKDFFSKCDQIRNFLRIQSHLLKKSLIKNFVFLCSVHYSGKIHDTDHPINNQRFYKQYYFQIFRFTKRFTFI